MKYSIKFESISRIYPVTVSHILQHTCHSLLKSLKKLSISLFTFVLLFFSSLRDIGAQAPSYKIENNKEIGFQIRDVIQDPKTNYK